MQGFQGGYVPCGSSFTAAVGIRRCEPAGKQTGACVTTASSRLPPAACRCRLLCRTLALLVSSPACTVSTLAGERLQRTVHCACLRTVRNAGI